MVKENGDFAKSVAKLMAAENNDVECRLGMTNGGSITFLDWKYTFGDPVVRPYPEEMKSTKTRNGLRNFMMVVPVTLENTQPKKRSHDRSFKLHRPDGEVYDGRTTIPDWVKEAMGKPNVNTDFDNYAPNEKRDGFVMFSVGSPTSAIGGVMRVFSTGKVPGTRRHVMKDQICVEVMAADEVEPLVKP
jgi:hypothetical protein